MFGHEFQFFEILQFVNLLFKHFFFYSKARFHNKIKIFLCAVKTHHVWNLCYN